MIHIKKLETHKESSFNKEQVFCHVKILNVATNILYLVYSDKLFMGEIAYTTKSITACQLQNSPA